MSGDALIVESPDEATAVLTLNRPKRRNSLTIELMRSVCEAFESLAAEPRRRVIIVRGAGPVFCAGLDLHEAADIGVAEQSAEWVARMLETMVASPLVTIAAAQGAAYGGGAGVMACCDLVVASDDLQVSFPEVRRGLVAALAAVTLLGRMRDGDLRELVLLGEPISVERAVGVGLVQRVVPRDRLLAEAHEMAAAVLRGAPEAVRHTKRLLRELRGADPLQLFPKALELHKQARLSEEAREGMAAFRERREPKWPES